MRKWLTTLSLLSAVAMELAYQLTRRNLDLNLVWRRRDTNVDALTTGKDMWAAPSRRIDNPATLIKGSSS